MVGKRCGRCHFALNQLRIQDSWEQLVDAVEHEGDGLASRTSRCRILHQGILPQPFFVRMNPRQSNVGEDSQEQFPGGNIGAYQHGWHPYMYGYQCPPPCWLPQGFQPCPPNVAMMNPSAYAPEGSRQTEIPEVCVHDAEAELAEVPASTSKKRNENAVTRIKLSNFTPDEDKYLVESWLEISCESVTSTGQKKYRMWDRIIQRYNSKRGSNPERSVKSLQSRWDTIRAEVTLFASYYADSIRENPSGMSNADKTTLAAGNFADVLQRKFGFLHCWEIMKDAPKWQDPNARDIATAARGEGFGEASAAGTDTVDLADGQGSPIPSAYAPEGSRQAEIPEVCVHDAEAELAEVPASTSKKRNKNAVTRIKLSNFTPDEDKYLVKSWLEISCEPVTSTGQKKDRMWDRIIQRYNSKRGSNPERSVRSLQSRWDTIRAEVTLFASYYADSIRENPSGLSNADKTTLAAGNFADALQRKFGFLHCWEIMKDAPKWQDPNARDIATAARGEGFGEASAAGNDTIDLPDGQGSPVRSGAQARRPMGRDSAKAAKKKADSDAGSTSSAEYAAKMQDLSLQRISIMQQEAVRRNDRFQQLASIDEKRFEEMRRQNEALIQIEQEKIRIMREQHEDERRKQEKKEDERILMIDLDACPPNLRLYYQTCQQEILERQAARRRRSEGS